MLNLIGHIIELRKRDYIVKRQRMDFSTARKYSPCLGLWFQSHMGTCSLLVRSCKTFIAEIKKMKFHTSEVESVCIVSFLGHGMGLCNGGGMRTWPCTHHANTPTCPVITMPPPRDVIYPWGFLWSPSHASRVLFASLYHITTYN